jgi:hypothetical protein
LKISEKLAAHQERNEKRKKISIHFIMKKKSIELKIGYNKKEEMIMIEYSGQENTKRCRRDQNSRHITILQ